MLETQPFKTKRKRYSTTACHGARRVVENGFGILVQRFRMLYSRLQVQPGNADTIVVTCLVLHNFLRNDILQEYWATDTVPVQTVFEPVHHVGTHANADACEVRRKFQQYFTQSDQVPWQESLVLRGRNST